MSTFSTNIASDEIARADAYDELPLWSAPFGLALLDTVVLRPGIVALDVGCGTGFPIIELAERLGKSAQVHGVDPSGAALARARKKLAVKAVTNVTLHEMYAEQLPFADRTVDLIVSNNGFNNVSDFAAVIAECARVARPGAQLVYTYNLPESMHELYTAYDRLLLELEMTAARERLAAHIFARRKPLAFTTDVLERAGFRVERIQQSSFRLRFVDANAMLEHFLVRVAFLSSWSAVLDATDRESVFGELIQRLQRAAVAAGELTLTIPFACYDCRRHA
jgi:ubiquinone/menaquinone biosynthesis C-methylase UbiE